MEGPNPQLLVDLVTMKMPFGKYKGTTLCDLPTYYLEWFAKEGFPNGKLGMLLSTIFEIKINGLEDLLKPLKNKRRFEEPTPTIPTQEGSNPAEN